MLSQYDDFMLKNASQISAIEGTLRSLTYVLPGRFNDAEIASEALFSGLNVLGLYHDFILVKAVAKNGKKQLHQPSPHNRYTRYWVNASSNYKRLALMLTIIQYSQVLIEMGVIKRWGKETRWKLVLGVEMLKAATRLYLVRLTQGRAVVHPPVPEREIDPASLEDAEQHSNHSSIQHPLLGGLNANGNGHAMNGSSAHIHQNGANIESAYRNLHELNGHSVDNYLLSKVLKADDVKPAKDLLRPLPSLGKLAEGMHIMRPLFYVLAIRKYGERSWRPWFVSLLCELASRQLAQQARNFKMETSLEAEEQRRRTWALLWSCFRGPFYAEYTKPLVDDFCAAMERRPLLGLVAGILRDYQPLWENFYFYTSAS